MIGSQGGTLKIKIANDINVSKKVKCKRGVGNNLSEADIKDFFFKARQPPKLVKITPNAEVE